MPVEWEKAPEEVINTAEQLIRDYHPDLEGADIGFLFRSTAPESRGRVTLGKAQKVPDKLRPYLNLHFIIWLAADRWAAMNGEQREALIDHELSHCKMDADGKTYVVGHDIEEFEHILDRYGLWNANLFSAKSAMTSALQLRLGGMGRGKIVAVDPEKAMISVEMS